MTTHHPDPDGTVRPEPVAEPLRPTWAASSEAPEPSAYAAPLAPVAAAGPSKARVGLVVGAAAALGLGAVATSFAATPAPAAVTAPAAVSAPVAPGLAGGGPAVAAIAIDPLADDGSDTVDRGRFGGPGGFRDVTISAISGSNVTLSTDDGWTRIIAISGDVELTKGGQTIAVSDLAVGDEVRFAQTRNDDGTYTVTAVAVVVPSVSGTISDLGDTSFKVTTRDGSVWTISTNGSTTYRFGLADGTRADLADGGAVYVEGTTTGDNALTALSVTVAADRASGTVTAKTADTITLKTRDGGTVTVNVSADTTYRVAGVTDADLGDITVDMVVSVQGRTGSGSVIDASAVVAGKGFGRGDGFPGLGGMGRHDGMGGPGFGDDDAAPSASPSATP